MTDDLTDDFDDLLSRRALWRTLRVGAWIARFLHNTKVQRGKRIAGPLTTEELDKQKLFWEKRAQRQYAGSNHFQEDRLKLNLQVNHDGLLECRGRIQGDYPVYLPDSAIYAEKLVQYAHEVTLHGGVGLTMAKVRETHWIPRLRQLTKRVIRRCYGCKRFNLTALANPPPGNLPQDRTVGNGTLAWSELQDVLLDVEVALNNRPLSYVEEDIQLPLLTPNLLQFGRPNLLPEPEDHHQENPDLRRRARYLAKCKDVVWKRWSTEYLRGLRERHNMKHNQRQQSLSKGNVVMIKGEGKNRGHWKLGIVEELFPGRDGVARSVRLRAGKSFLERPIQHLYPLELSCDRTAVVLNRSLNPKAPVFRSKRDAAVAANVRIQNQAEDEQCS